MTATASEPAAARQVESLVPELRRPGCVRVMVAGRPLLTIPVEVAREERLAPGTELDEALLGRLTRAADLEGAYATVLRLVARRPFAAKDLARRLTIKGHPAPLAAAAVERAGRAGLVDDAQFARHYAETRGARGRGPDRIRRDLGVLGVARDVVERALVDAFGEDGGRAPSADALARKRLKQLRGLPRQAQRRRLLAFLGRRGFRGEPVSRLVAALLRESAG
jgi:regulatory protein